VAGRHRDDEPQVVSLLHLLERRRDHLMVLRRAVLREVVVVRVLRVRDGELRELDEVFLGLAQAEQALRRRDLPANVVGFV